MSGGREGEGGGGKLPSVDHGPRTEGGRDKNVETVQPAVEMQLTEVRLEVDWRLIV